MAISFLRSVGPSSCRARPDARDEAKGEIMPSGMQEANSEAYYNAASESGWNRLAAANKKARSRLIASAKLHLVSDSDIRNDALAYIVLFSKRKRTGDLLAIYLHSLGGARENDALEHRKVHSRRDRSSHASVSLFPPELS